MALPFRLIRSVEQIGGRSVARIGDPWPPNGRARRAQGRDKRPNAARHMQNGGVMETHRGKTDDSDVPHTGDALGGRAPSTLGLAQCPPRPLSLNPAITVWRCWDENTQEPRPASAPHLACTAHNLPAPTTQQSSANLKSSKVPLLSRHTFLLRTVQVKKKKKARNGHNRCVKKRARGRHISFFPPQSFPFSLFFVSTCPV